MNILQSVLMAAVFVFPTPVTATTSPVDSFSQVRNINNLSSSMNNDRNNTGFDVFGGVTQTLANGISVTSPNLESKGFDTFQSKDIATTSGTNSSINLIPFSHQISTHHQLSDSPNGASRDAEPDKSTFTVSFVSTSSNTLPRAVNLMQRFSNEASGTFRTDSFHTLNNSPISETKQAPIPAILEKIAACESKNNPRAKNKASSASGKFQIIYGTWYEEGLKLWGEDFYNKNVWNSKDNTDLAVYLYKKYNTSPWNSSKSCWSPTNGG